MARSKSHKEDEDLRGLLRELKAENKALRRRLRQLEKSKHVYEQFNLDSDEREEQVKETKEETCTSCGKGTLLPLDLGRIGRYTICSACSFRKKSNG